MQDWLTTLAAAALAALAEALVTRLVGALAARWRTV